MGFWNPWSPNGPHSAVPGVPHPASTGAGSEHPPGPGAAGGAAAPHRTGLRPFIPSPTGPRAPCPRSPSSAYPEAGGGRRPPLGPGPAPVRACPPLLPRHPTPPHPQCSASFRHRIPWNGGRGREIRTQPPAASAPRAPGARRAGRAGLTFALHGVHEVPLVELAAELLLQAEAADADDLLHVRQVLVLVVSLAVNRALRGPQPESPATLLGGRPSPGAPLEQVQRLHPTNATRATWRKSQRCFKSGERGVGRGARAPPGLRLRPIRPLLCGFSEGHSRDIWRTPLAPHPRSAGSRVM